MPLKRTRTRPIETPSLANDPRPVPALLLRASAPLLEKTQEQEPPGPMVAPSTLDTPNEGAAYRPAPCWLTRPKPISSTVNAPVATGC